MLGYNEQVLKHFFKPACIQELDSVEPILRVRSGHCDLGEAVEIGIILADGGIVKQVYFKALGCPYLIACLSYLCGYLKGNSIAKIGQLDESKLIDLFSMPRNKQHVAFFCMDCMHKLQEKVGKKYEK